MSFISEFSEGNAQFTVCARVNICSRFHTWFLLNSRNRSSPLNLSKKLASERDASYPSTPFPNNFWDLWSRADFSFWIFLSVFYSYSLLGQFLDWGLWRGTPASATRPSATGVGGAGTAWVSWDCPSSSFSTHVDKSLTNILYWYSFVFCFNIVVVENSVFAS